MVRPHWRHNVGGTRQFVAGAITTPLPATPVSATNCRRRLLRQSRRQFVTRRHFVASVDVTLWSVYVN